MAAAATGAKMTAAFGGRREESVLAARQARHIGSLSIKPEPEMLRSHEEQTNVVMALIPRN